MADQMTKAALLDKIATSYTTWQTLVERVPRAQMAAPGFAGEWSLKDVIAHLTVFERIIADHLEASTLGEQAPKRAPWGPPDANTSDVDAENAAYYRHYRETPLEEVLAAAKEHHQRLVAGIERLDESDIHESERFAWTGGQPLWQAVQGNSYEHYDDHLPSLRAWVDAHPA
ncbi:MAG TPA: ClbS/DfsB family four-helix bundle protein [Ktedonobacterales bacterium]